MAMFIDRRTMPRTATATSVVAVKASLLAVVAALVAISSAQAQTLTTWLGNGSDANWATSGNWSSTPTTSGTWQLFFSGSNQLTNANNIGSVPFNVLQFSSNAGAFVVSGSALAGSGNIRNNSAANQTVTNDIAMTSAINFSGTGTGVLNLAGNISGTTAINLNDTSGRQIVEFSGSNSNGSSTRVEAGLLKFTSANAMSPTTNLRFSTDTTRPGGVFGITSDFSRPLGASAGGGGISMIGNGGFAAFGATRSVTISSGATLNWGSTSNFLSSVSTLLFSHTTSDATLNFVNAINLDVSGTNAATRTIDVRNGSAAVDGRLGGIISGTASLRKIGVGTLELAANNTYKGSTFVDAGTLLVNGNQTSATGTITVVAGAILGGTGTTGALTATITGTLAPGLATGLGTLTFAGSTVDLSAGSLVASLNADPTQFASDLLAITGSGSLNLGGSSILDITGPTSFTTSGTYTLATFASAASQFATVRYNGATQGSPTTAGGVNGSGQLVYNGTDLQLVVVPEPATIALAGLGLGCVGFAAWRRRGGRRQARR